jgi:hypothetical protein
MGNSPRNGNSYAAGRPAPANPTARAIYKPPVDKNGQTMITDNLKGMVGGAWTPDQIKAGGRWEVPAGAPAGAIGRNFVPYVEPVSQARNQLAAAMVPRNRRWAEGWGGEGGSSHWGGGRGEHA